MAGVIQRDCLDLTRLLQSGACLFRISSKNDDLLERIVTMGQMLQ